MFLIVRYLILKSAYRDDEIKCYTILLYNALFDMVIVFTLEFLILMKMFGLPHISFDHQTFYFAILVTLYAI